MRYETVDGFVKVYLEGRISSSNAAETQRELAAIRAQEPGKLLTIDAGALEYISSAGLRVLLQLTKEQKNALTVENVSPEVYEILDMTGFTSILQVKKRLREFSVEGCEVVGSGAVGTVYRVDEDTIVKVYEAPDSIAAIENEQKRAKQAFLRGIPTAISYDVVRVGDRYGSVFEMLKASNYNDLLRHAPERKEEIIREYAHFLRKVHAVEMAPGELPDARDEFRGYLDALRDCLPQALADRLRALFAAMPEDLHAIHGDIHMKNVMLSGDEPLLIDMETLRVGNPVFDLQGLLVTYRLFGEDDPNNSTEFLGIPQALADEVWEKTLRYYFDDRGEAEIRAAEQKIRVVAYVQFLYYVVVCGYGGEALKQRRTEKTLAALDELSKTVDSLQIE